MPIPIIIWAAAAAGSAYLAWKNKDKISDFLESTEGRELIKYGGEAIEGYIKPIKQILEESYTMDTAKRRNYFLDKKEKMSSSDWNHLVIYGKQISASNPKYLAAVVDLLYVDDLEE